MARKLFTTAELEKAIDELLVSLTGEEVQIYLVGGTAISLGYFERRLTTDVDAKLAPVEVILNASEKIAQKRGWPKDWLNNNAMQFMTIMDGAQDWVLYKVLGKAQVFIASAELLLAMKLNASRIERDFNDIQGLINHLKLTSAKEAEEHFEHFYPGEILSSSALKILAEIFASQVN